MSAPDPFTIEIAPEAVDDLRRRVAATRWPQRIPGDETWELGVPAATLRRLAERWSGGYDWFEQQGAMNLLPHFVVVLDGAPVHFMHVRGEGPDPLPIILSHGWPGSFLELTALADRLARPSRYGGDSRRSFDVVVPSLPGFGFSAQRPERTDPWTTPELWHQLMQTLGYSRYAAHGGDLGAGITTRLAARHPEAVVGIHLLAVAAPQVTDSSSLTDAERAHVAEIERWKRHEGAYEHQQQTRPLTLAYGLSDSPLGMLAWLTEKLRAWSDCDGDLSNSFRDDEILTWASLYWLTNTTVSSFRPYNDSYAAPAVTPRVSVPTALAVFPHDLTHPPREWAERGYAIARYTEMPRGGHFAAFEEPDLLAEDISSFYSELHLASAG